LLEDLINHTLQPMPQLLCWQLTCRKTNDIWDPLEMSLDQWRQNHPLFEVSASNRYFSATEADVYREQLRGCIVDEHRCCAK
jgi:hypothetical protein